MKLLKIACLLTSVPLAALGGEGLYHVARNRQPVVLTCDQFVQNPPRALWLRITGCDVDYMNVGYQEESGRIVALLFPVRLKGQPSGPAALVAATRDPEALAIVQDTIIGRAPADSELFLVSMLRIVTKLRLSREVEGCARSGAIDAWRTRAILSVLKVPLAQRFAVLDLHTRPSYLGAGVQTGAGLLLLVVGLTVRSRPAPTAMHEIEPPEALATAVDATVCAPDPPEAVREPAIVVDPPQRLPAMLLLNLDLHADAGAIEHAPPIGTRSDTITAVRKALGAVDVDGDGCATARGPGWTLRLDPGREEPVWTVTATACGDESLPALQTLLRDTGWRIFIPKVGRFVDPSHLSRLPGPPTDHD
jgi:hypothetical protein